MSDLVSRQDAISAIVHELDMIDHVPQWVSDRLVKALRGVPSIDAVNHTADYDEKNDILFVHLSPDNSNSYGEEIDKNIIIMRDMDSNEITGVMLYGFNKYVKHGRWIEEPNCMYRCSNCGSHYPSIRGYMDYNYCPSCGAIMDERKES